MLKFRGSNADFKIWCDALSWNYGDFTVEGFLDWRMS